MTTLADIRRNSLQILVDKYGATEVARRLNKPASQINDMLAKRKSFGEKVARNMEATWAAGGHGYINLDLPSLFKDEEHVEGAPTEQFPQSSAPDIEASSLLPGDGPPRNSFKTPYQTALKEGVVKNLPEELRGNLDKALRLGRVTERVDYMSDRLVVEWKRANHFAVDTGLLQLAMIRALIADSEDKRRYLLILISEQYGFPGLQHAMIRGSILGITVDGARSFEEVAYIIRKYELEPPEED